MFLSDDLIVMDYVAGFLLFYVRFLQDEDCGFLANNMQSDYYFQPVQIRNHHHCMHIHNLSSV